jgi:hypothetical protein
VEKGFDFLGQNVCRYPNGKLLIKPSKKNVKTFLAGIRVTIKAGLGMSAADLIDQLNPKIRGWANYHRHVVSKRTFSHVDHSIFQSLWRWARRRHPKKSSTWLKEKYYERNRGNNWCFFGDRCDDEGGSPARLGCTTPTAPPSNDTPKSKAKPTPTIRRMKPISKTGKVLTCWTRSGVPKLFAFSGRSNAASALFAIPKSLASRAGAFITAFLS